MKKNYLLLFITFYNAVGFSQTTETRPAVSDNSMYSERPNNSNGIGENIFSGQTNGGGNRRALVKFSFPGVPLGGGYAVTSATLKLYCNLTPPSGGPYNFSVHRVTRAWGEGTSDAPAAEGTGTAATPGDATWINASHSTTPWTTQGGDYISTASASASVDAAGMYYSWSSPQLIADVQNWMNVVTPNNGWIVIGDEATFQSARRFGSRENPDASTRPILEITYSIIPVKLTSFTASETTSGVLLNWSTAQEYNNSFFSIEHSIDGINFSTIAKINGMGVFQTTQHYNFLHSSSNAGKHFYRLVQTDKDGKSTTASTIFIIVDKINTQNVLLANVTNNQLVVKNYPIGLSSSYTVFNSIGNRVLFDKLLSNSIDVSKLNSGLYYIKINNSMGQSISERFLKH